MIEAPHVIACESCDAVYRRTALRPREVARCSRCGGELARPSGEQSHRLLPLTLASLAMFGVANVFPIVEIELRGLRSRTTLTGAVVALATEGQWLVASLVLLTTLVFPLLQMLSLVWLLVPLARHRLPAGFVPIVQTLQTLRPWGMVEVFLLGVLVALVKLSGLATVVPGPALWGFMALTVLMTIVLSFDPRGFWDLSRTLEADNVSGRSAA